MNIIRAIIITVVLGGITFFVLAQSVSDSSDYPAASEFAPNLWFDSEERYYPTSPLDFYYDENLNELAGKEAKKNYDNLSKEEKLENFKVFYNIDSSGNELVYQYWLFYVFNDFNNEHYGDWESVFVFASQSGEIYKVVASAHNGTQTKLFLANDEVVSPAYEHSLVLVEKGSHANCLDDNKNGLFDRGSDSSNAYNSYCTFAFFTWSKIDKLNGLKVPYDSPYYDLRPLSEIKDQFEKKYGEDRPLITKEKSPTLGMVTFKIGKKKFYALPLGGAPPSNAWSKKEYEDPKQVIPLTPRRLAKNISEFVTDTGSTIARIGSEKIISPAKNLFHASIKLAGSIGKSIGGFFKDAGKFIASIGSRATSQVTNLFTASVGRNNTSGQTPEVPSETSPGLAGDSNEAPDLADLEEEDEIVEVIRLDISKEAPPVPQPVVPAIAPEPREPDEVEQNETSQIPQPVGDQDKIEEEPLDPAEDKQEEPQKIVKKIVLPPPSGPISPSPLLQRRVA